MTIVTMSNQAADDQRAKSPRRHKCSVCERAFRRSEHLQRHMRIHSGERQHVCKVVGCQKRFGRADELKVHTRAHYDPSSRHSRAKPNLDYRATPATEAGFPWSSGTQPNTSSQESVNRLNIDFNLVFPRTSAQMPYDRLGSEVFTPYVTYSVTTAQPSMNQALAGQDNTSLFTASPCRTSISNESNSIHAQSPDSEDSLHPALFRSDSEQSSDGHPNTLHFSLQVYYPSSLHTADTSSLPGISPLASASPEKPLPTGSSRRWTTDSVTWNRGFQEGELQHHKSKFAAITAFGDRPVDTSPPSRHRHSPPLRISDIVNQEDYSQRTLPIPDRALR